MSDKYQVILISHNKLAEGVLKAAKMIAGKEIDAIAYGLMPGENPDEKINVIKKEINIKSHTIILADLFGGSMANAAIKLSTEDNVKLITGLNLALVLQVILEKPWSEEDLTKVLEQARDNIKEVKLTSVEDNEDDFF